MRTVNLFCPEWHFFFFAALIPHWNVIEAVAVNSLSVCPFVNLSVWPSVTSVAGGLLFASSIHMQMTC